MKKNIVKTLLVLSTLLTLNAFAQMGYVDSAAVYTSMPLAQNYQKQIKAKLTEIKDFNAQTQNLINAQTTKEAKLKVKETRNNAYKKLEKEYIDLRNKYSKEAKAKLEKACETVRVQKNLEMIVEKASRLSGGVDCTQDVIKAAK